MVDQPHSRAEGRRRAPREFARTWAGCAVLLVLVFVGLESLVGQHAAGHPGGVTAMFAHGGWWAIPVVIWISLAVAAVVHGARWVVHVVRRRRQGRRAYSAAGQSQLVWLAQDVQAAAPAPWLGGWSSRGPPRAVPA